MTDQAEGTGTCSTCRHWLEKSNCGRITHESEGAFLTSSTAAMATEPTFGCSEWYPIPEKCSGCGNDIDPEVCWCGELLKGHGFDGHFFVPMGCDCYRANKPEEEREMNVVKYGAGETKPSEKPAEEPPRPPWFRQEIMGWACPRCGRCYAPTIGRCPDCGPGDRVSDAGCQCSGKGPCAATLGDVLRKVAELLERDNRCDDDCRCSVCRARETLGFLSGHGHTIEDAL